MKLITHNDSCETYYLCWWFPETVAHFGAGEHITWWYFNVDVAAC
jgi:hypothetical protein